MDIIIPTLGRCDMQVQTTFNQLRKAGYRPIMVVQPHEAYWWAESVERGMCVPHVLPSHIKGIAATRDYIIHEMEGDDHVVMLDDDLHFAVRRDDDRTKFRQPEVHDLRNMMNTMDATLEVSPHVAIGSREGGNRVTDAVVFNTRMMRVLGYRRSFLKQNHICFTPMQVMEDFHVTLQILRLGQDCAVLNNWVSNQAGGSGAKGGCSTFRTPELQELNAERLAKRHPGFVKVVKKTTKGAWGGGERTDVVVAWKKARAAAGEIHAQNR